MLTRIVTQPDPYEPYPLPQAIRAGGSDLAHVAKVTIFVTDMQAQFQDVVALRRKFWSEPIGPTRSSRSRRSTIRR